MPHLPGLGREEAKHQLRRVRQVAQGLPRPARLPAMRSRQPRQPRRTMPPLPADHPYRRSALGIQPGAGPAGSARFSPARRAPAEGVVAAPSRQLQRQADPRRSRSRQAGDPARRPRPAQPVSPHLVDPAQTVLFEVRRDWRCITVGALGPAARPHPCRRGPGRRVRSACPAPAAGPAAHATTGPRP